MNGIINIYKEKGFTSHDVVAKLRGIFKQKKIGHTGTLDPDAEGVLPVALGNATKVCDLITDKDKAYRCLLLLGTTTDTQDISGNVLKESEVNVSEDGIIRAIKSFEGEYDQVPPMYSAIKINGKKLYELAREGKEIERPARRIRIHEIDIKEVNVPRVTMEVSCSKGTYIRTLCHDIGEKLGCGGVMEELLRIKSGDFELDSALKLSEVERLVKEGCIEERIISVDRVFKALPSVKCDKKAEKLLINGNRLPKEFIFGDKDTFKDGENVRLYDNAGQFVGIYEYKKNAGDFKPLKLFL